MFALADLASALGTRCCHRQNLPSRLPRLFCLSRSLLCYSASFISPRWPAAQLSYVAFAIVIAYARRAILQDRARSIGRTLQSRGMSGARIVSLHCRHRQLVINSWNCAECDTLVKKRIALTKPQSLPDGIFQIRCGRSSRLHTTK